MKQEQIFAEYRDHMGSDLTIVNAARASFGKESEWLPSGSINDYPGVIFQQRHIAGAIRPVNLSQADANLIRFLATGFRTAEWDEFLDQIIVKVSDMVLKGTLDAGRADLTTLLHAYKRKPQHWAPFAHGQVQIRVSMPIFLARQFVKHQVGAVWSEESRRYISEEPGVWFPGEWHTRPEDIKQGSGDVITHMEWNDGGDVEREEIDPIVKELTRQQLFAYDQMVKGGIAPEEARIVLPLNMMTTVVWTGSLLFWSRVYNLRADSHAQLAAQELAKIIGGIVEPLFPESWKALTE